MRRLFGETSASVLAYSDTLCSDARFSSKNTSSCSPRATKIKIMTYSQTLSLQKQQAYRRNQNTYSIRAATLKVGPVSTIIVVVALVCLMGIVYLSQVTKTNSYGYSINSLSQKEESLKIERSDLELEAIKLQSLERVKTSQVAANLTQLQPTQINQ
jgi:cell division protein FtsL